MGHLSPLDGIGPDDIGLDLLEQRLEQENLTEVILATNPTVEGDATANYIAELCAQPSPAQPSPAWWRAALCTACRSVESLKWWMAPRFLIRWRGVIPSACSGCAAFSSVRCRLHLTPRWG